MKSDRVAAFTCFLSQRFRCTLSRMAYYDRDYYAEAPNRTERSLRLEPLSRAIIILLAAVYIVCAIATSDPLHAGRSAIFNSWVGALLLQPNALLPMDSSWPWPGAWQLASAPLICSGMLDLVFSALALWLIGSPLEARIGARRMLLFILSSMLLANLAAALIDPLLAPHAVSMGPGAVTIAMLMALIRLAPPATTGLFGLPTRALGWILVIFAAAISFGSYFAEDRSALRMVFSLPALVAGALWGHYFFSLKIGQTLSIVRRRQPPQEDFYAYARQFAIKEDANAQSEQSEKSTKKQLARERTEQAEVDTLLERISKEGIGSLSRGERSFLEKYSQRKKEHRGP